MTINRILGLDALTCALMGVALIGWAQPISLLIALPRDVLFYAGCLLIPIALFMAILAWQSTPWRTGVWLVVIGNAAWVLASVAVALVVGPNILGALFVGIQALFVAVLAVAEFNAALRRQRPALLA